MSHPLANSNSSAAYRGFAPTNKGRGYLPFDTITEHNAIGGGFETTGTSQQTGGNGDDKWERFFGTPPYTTWQRDNYSDLGHENYQLPTAYIGRNLHIEKLLNVSIASQDDFYTRVLLPWKVYDGMKITFSKWSGFDHMMYQIPEEVPAPQIQTKFESGEAYQQRYGLAFKMEHGFQRTEMGRQAYTMNLQIITQAVLRTVYSRIMQVLVHNQNWLQVLANRYYPSRMALAREISKTSVNSFGCMQKETFGLQIVMNSVQKLFEARQLQSPDSIVLPHGCMAYMSLAKPENRIFALCGALAEKLNVDPKRELAVNVFGNNLQVFEHRPMNVSDSPHEVSVLTRNRDVGNVWRLFRDGVSHSSNDSTAIRIIDHDKQRWGTITMEDALKRCGIWNPAHEIKTDARFNDGANQPNDHLANNSKRAFNPLYNKHIFGDLISSYNTKYGQAFSPTTNNFRGALDVNTDIGYMSRWVAATGVVDASIGVAAAPGVAAAQDLAYAGVPLTTGNTAAADILAAFTAFQQIPAAGSYSPAPLSYDEFMKRYNWCMDKFMRDAAVTVYYENPYTKAGFEADKNMPIQLTTKTLMSAVKRIEELLETKVEQATLATAKAHMNAQAPAGALDATGATAGDANGNACNVVFNSLKSMMPNNVIRSYDDFKEANGGTNAELMRGGTKGPLRQTQIAAPIGASMEELVSTLQDSVASQVDGFDGTDEEYETISTGIADILSRAGDWSSEKRYAVGQAIGQHASEFTKSIAKLQALKQNNDAGSSKALAKDYVKALGSDFKSKWSKINASQKEITKAASAAPIGAAVTGLTTQGDLRGQLFDYDNLAQFDRIMGWVFSPASGLDGYEMQIAKYWLSNTLDFRSIAALDARGIPTPFGALVFRPFQAFNMGSAIIMKSGDQTGFTAVGNSDFQLGDNVTNKTHLGHFTFYFEPVVHEPNHIMIARDICFMGYHGGAGMGWFADRRESDMRGQGPAVDRDGGWGDIVTKIQSAHLIRPSLLSALAFAHESEDKYFMDPMSIHGTFDRSSILNDLQEQDTLHYASAAYYKSLLDPEVGNTIDETTSAATGGMFHNSSSSGVCYQGLQCMRTADGKWEDFISNTGHLGKAESLDSSLVWSGQIATKTSVNYEKAGNSVSLFNKYT